ncbi:MAG: hypothetical protein ACRDMV_04160 [Streptosporangiales bacterium]
MRIPWTKHSSRPFVRWLTSRREVTRTQDPQAALITTRDRIRNDAYTGLRSPADTTMLLGEMSKLTGNLDQMLARVDRYLRREQASDRVVAVEGMFTGEADTAVDTAHVWLEEATVAARQLREAIDNAQIVTSGLARPSPTEPVRSPR